MPAKNKYSEGPCIGPNRLIEKNTELTVKIKISCQDLPISPILSQALPKVYVFINKDQIPSMQAEADFLTEHIFDNSNPVFENQIELKYELGSEYYIRFIVANALDINSKDYNNQEIIGEFNLKFTDLVLKNSNIIKGYLREVDKNTLTPFTIKLELIQCPISHQVVKLHLKAKNIIKNNVIGIAKSLSTYLVIYREATNESHWSPIYSTSVVEGSNNPEWKHIGISLYNLCKGNFKLKLKLEIREYIQFGKYYPVLGYIETNLKHLVEHLNQPLHINATKLIKAKERPSLTPAGYEVDTSSLSLIDYLQAGMRLNCMIGIDFTRSNLHPTNLKSFHFKDEDNSKDSSYERILKGIIEKISPYTHEKLFELYGFGGKDKYTGFIEPCVKLGQEYHNRLAGVNYVVEAYHSALERFELWGPSNLSHVIEQSIRMSRSNDNPNIDYNLLFIITDGLISDLDNMVEALVDSTKFPLSIVFLVIGNNYNKEFKEMINSDQLLQTKFNRKSTRVNTCFFQLPDPIPTKGIKKLIGQYISTIPSHISQFMKYRQNEIIHYQKKNKIDVDEVNFGETKLPRNIRASYDKSYSIGQDSYYFADSTRDSMKSDDMSKHVKLFRNSKLKSKETINSKESDHPAISKKSSNLSAIPSDDFALKENVYISIDTNTNKSLSINPDTEGNSQIESATTSSMVQAHTNEDNLIQLDSTHTETQSYSSQRSSQISHFRYEFSRLSCISDLSVPPNSELSIMESDFSQLTEEDRGHSPSLDDDSQLSTTYDLSSMISVPPNSDISESRSIIDLTQDLLSTLDEKNIDEKKATPQEKDNDNDSGVEDDDEVLNNKTESRLTQTVEDFIEVE